MINYFSPINYNTGVNPIIFAYNSGAAFGYRPGTLPGYTPQFNMFANNYSFGGSIFNTGATYQTNNLQTLLNATNPTMGYTQNFGNIYNFGGTINFGNNNNAAKIASTTSPQPTTSIKPSTITNSTPTGYTRKTLDSGQLATTAQNYLGCSEANNGHLKFLINPECHRMDPYNEEWCTDFVTYVTKETYKKQGLNMPYWFGSHDVATLKRQADSHGKFINTYTKLNKAEYISKNIKKGDIMILNQNGASHTGFVTKVNTDGSFETIEGNVGDPNGKGYGVVTTGHYSPYDKELSGFIKLA